MATYQAFTLASLSLARGDNPAKQIVILTDEQNIGWETGKAGQWSFLRDAFQNLTTEPQILLRKLSLPDYIRNLAVTDVTFHAILSGSTAPSTSPSQFVINEAVTPGALLLSVGENRPYDQSIARPNPGKTNRHLSTSSPIPALTTSRLNSKSRMTSLPTTRASTPRMSPTVSRYSLSMDVLPAGFLTGHRLLPRLPSLLRPSLSTLLSRPIAKLSLMNRPTTLTCSTTPPST